MYRVGQYIVYGGEGVCRVEQIGPVDIRGAKKGQEYYTLVSVYHQGRVYLPVDAEGYSRPILTREEAQSLLEELPQIEAEVFACTNPRLLTEHYQKQMKGGSCRDLLSVIRSIRAKGAEAARKGRKLGMVDERVLKQAEEKVCGELAVCLELSVEEVKAVLTARLKAAEA